MEQTVFVSLAESRCCRLLTLRYHTNCVFAWFCLQAWSGKTTSQLWRRAAIFSVSNTLYLSTTPSPSQHGAALLCPGVAFCPKPACFSLMSASQISSCEKKTQTYWVVGADFYDTADGRLSITSPTFSQRPSCRQRGLMCHPHLFFYQTASLDLMEKLSNRPDLILFTSNSSPHLPPLLWWVRDFNGFFSLSLLQMDSKHLLLMTSQPRRAVRRCIQPSQLLVWHDHWLWCEKTASCITPLVPFQLQSSLEAARLRPWIRAVKWKQKCYQITRF